MEATALRPQANEVADFAERILERFVKDIDTLAGVLFGDVQPPQPNKPSDEAATPDSVQQAIDRAGRVLSDIAAQLNRLESINERIVSATATASNTAPRTSSFIDETRPALGRVR